MVCYCGAHATRLAGKGALLRLLLSRPHSRKGRLSLRIDLGGISGLVDRHHAVSSPHGLAPGRLQLEGHVDDASCWI